MNKIAPQGESTFQPGTAANATSTIEISIQCRDLANKDVLSKSDPMCVVFNKQMNTKKWCEVLRTEVIQNNLNPDWVTKVTMEYRFEQSQNVKFEVYDIDDGEGSLEEADGIGFIECTVANIVSAGSKGYTRQLDSFDEPGKTGTIILIAEELESLKDEVNLRISASSLGSIMNCFLPRTSFSISKIVDGGAYVVVYRSREIRGSNPIWPNVTITGRALCNGDKDRQLKLEAWKRTVKEEEDLIGFCFTTLNRMVNGMDDRMQLLGKNGQNISSCFNVISCSLTPIFTFFDFVNAGTKIHLLFSIDFTSSNGDPTHQTSLHHLSPDPKQTNAYEQAIAATGLIIKDYDDTGVFPVYGFGARIPPVGDTSHLFPVTLGNSPNCSGIEGVVRAYKSCISRVQLFGPTNISPVINRIIKIATASRAGQHYYILVIITDGVVTDMHQAKEAVIKAASLPISIIIVGVGEADFDAMEELDADGTVLTYNGKQADRDIVQFVEYRSAESWLKRTGESTVRAVPGQIPNIPPAGGGGMLGMVSFAQKEMTNLLAQGQLAEEILSEIPEQLQSYMKSKGLEPSMIHQEESKVEEVFVGAAEPEVAVEVDEKKTNSWNVMMLVKRGGNKFRAKSPNKKKVGTESAAPWGHKLNIPAVAVEQAN